MSDLPAPPPWPRCSRCQKPGHPDRRVFHEGKVFCCGDCLDARDDEVTQATLRRQVLERDKGVCALCSLDCLALRVELDALIKAIEIKSWSSTIRVAGMRKWEARVAQLARCGFDRHAVESGKSLWAADHIDERVKNGPTVLSNAQTLCLSCHAAKTSELATSRAASRRPLRRGFR